MLVDKKNLFYKIGFNTFVQFVGKIITVGLGFISVALLTRYLGTSGYGDFSIVFAYLSFFAVFADFGLQLTIVRELSQNNIKAGAIYGTYFWIKLGLVAASTLFALFVLLFFPYDQTLKIGILIGALAVGIGGLSGYGSAIFQSNIRLDLVTYIDLATKIVSVSLIALFVLLKLNFYYIISTILIGNLLGLIVTAYFLNRFISLDFKYDSVLARKIIRWSFPIGLTSFFSLAYFKLDTIMLSVIRGSSEVGIYSLAYKILENILVLWGFYMASVYPLLSTLSNDKRGFSDLLKKSVFVVFGLSIPIIFIGFIFASNFINLFGGGEFDASILPFKILLFSIPIFFINNLFYSLFLIKKKVKIVLYGMAFTLTINFLLNLIFIPKNGYIAASYITILSEFSLFMFYLSRVFKLKNKILELSS